MVKDILNNLMEELSFLETYDVNGVQESESGATEIEYKGTVMDIDSGDFIRQEDVLRIINKYNAKI